MISSRAWDFVMETSWLLHRPVLENVAMIVGRHAEGIKVDPAEVARIVETRDAAIDHRQAAIAAETTHDGFGGGFFEPVRTNNVKPDELGPLVYQAKGTNVYVVPVHGVISKNAGMINGISSPRGISTDRMIRSLLAAGDLAERNDGSVLIDANSPGGTTAGMQDVGETVKHIREMGVPVVAIARDLMASGGLVVGVQADRVYATPHAMVGSIGTYRYFVDTSARNEARGIKPVLVSSGPYKGFGAEGMPITDEQIEQHQREVDAVCDWFIDLVAERRQLNRDSVKTLATGAMWLGKQAQEIGLVDGVTGIVELIRSMHAQR